MQPKSIQRFDMFFLGSVISYTVAFFIGYDDTVALTRQKYAEAGLNIDPSVWVAVGFLIALAISGLLWWLISPKRNNVARWVLTVLFALSVISLAYVVLTGSFPSTTSLVLSLLTYGLEGVAIYYLFQPDAKPWFEPKAESK